jgi:hypothetical protein
MLSDIVVSFHKVPMVEEVMFSIVGYVAGVIPPSIAHPSHFSGLMGPFLSSIAYQLRACPLPLPLPPCCHGMSESYSGLTYQFPEFPKIFQVQCSAQHIQ